MKYTFNNFKYNKLMDPECIELCDCINSLPGLKTSESCCGHGKRPFIIFFYIENFDSLGEQGLFFLTRCIDRRYWKYGHIWKLELSVGDMSSITNYPTSFLLHSGDSKGDEAYNQCKDLIDNMIYHLNHKNFINEFKINLDNFKIKIK